MARDRESIIRKLKGLVAKTGSLKELGEEREAQAFTEMIQKLVTEHAIDMSEIESQERDEVDPIVRQRPDYVKYGISIRRRRVKWLEDLGSLVAWAHYCQILIHPGYSMLTFVGRKANAETACEVYCKLVNTAESIADKEYVKFFYECKRQGNERRARGFRTSFLIGFCRRIGERYYRYMDDLRTYYAHDQKALVALRDARSEVSDWVAGQKIPTDKREHPKDRIDNLTGLVRGQKRADDVELTKDKKLAS